MTQSPRVINTFQSNLAAIAGTSRSCHDQSNDRKPVANSTISSSVSARHPVMGKAEARLSIWIEYGSPLDVVRLDETETPAPGPGQIRIAVQACG
ncbi:hypothetical protein ACWEO2_39335, partial [Nocardia sp. NPDC004278]